MSSPAGEASSKPCVGPILVITFTNHALDQFLIGLVKAGIKDLVRVGGRGKTEELEEYNLINRCRCASDLLWPPGWEYKWQWPLLMGPSYLNSLIKPCLMLKGCSHLTPAALCHI